MTLTYRYRIDDLDLATSAFLVEEHPRRIAGRRRQSRRLSWRHGTLPSDPYFDEVAEGLAITVFATDDNGNTLHPEGAWGQLNHNLERLSAVLGKRGMIDVRKYVPDFEADDASPGDESPADDGPIELQGYAQVVREVPIRGDALTAVVQVDLLFPYPFWHELPMVELAANTSHQIWTGGTAPVADMVFTFTADGTVTAAGQSIAISGMSGSEVVVDVGKREVYEDGDLAMHLLGDGVDDNWMEWPANTLIEVTATSAVAIDFHRARHH